MSKSAHTAAPGGGSNVSGLGEAFSINLSTGQGTFAYKMPLPEGVAKHTPKLGLEYTHGTGNGTWGLGWRMATRSIVQRLDFGTPDGSLSEHFLDSGLELVPLADGSFRALRESMFSRYTRLAEGWRIEDRNGVVHELGLTASARVADPAHPNRVIEWLLERSTDVSGNEIRYSYVQDEGTAYLKTFRYAAYEVELSYSTRPDIRLDGKAGFLRRRALRCDRIELILDPTLAPRVIRSWQFEYALTAMSGVSLLTGIQLTAHGSAPDASLDIHRPPIRFGYSALDATQYRVQWMENQAGAPPGLAETDVALVTLDNAPLPGIVMNRNGRSHYWANRGNGEWAAPRPVAATALANSFARSGLAFVDMDGSGTADLMVADRNSQQGYYENTGREGWKNFVAFPRSRRSAPSWADKSMRMLDVDGNGLVDAMLSQRRAFAWWQNEGRQGWTEPRLAPKMQADLMALDFSDPDIHLADMTGDGLLDIVRVQSGRVDYWPNLGRGRFGERVLMQSAPRLQRGSVDTILFIDIDGDGCADMLHISSRGLMIYPNQNGQRFSDPVVIRNIPTPMAGTVRAVNLSGHSASGLMWNSLSSRGLGYVQFEFVAEQPPDLLTEIENGAGLRSELHYRSAVDDYLRDQRAGRFWATNFPFPYLVVRRIKETDAVSGRVVETEFAYHEAHFERHTRQFQGFRTTERIERGDVTRPDTRQVHRFLMAQEKEPGNAPQHAALNGMLSQVEIFQHDGTSKQERPFSVETSTYGLTTLDQAESTDSRKRSFVFVAQHRLIDSERTDDVRIEEKTYQYDAQGNVVQERLRGSGVKAGVAQPVRERVTDIEYATSATAYVVDKIARITARDAGGQLLSEKRFLYDGADFAGLPLGQAERGLATRTEEWVMTRAEFIDHYGAMNQAALGYLSGTNADGVDSVFALTQRSRIDAHGLLVASMDAMGQETSSIYDDDHLFRVKLIDALGESRFTYDRVTGQTTRIRYATGLETQFAYDAQGRVLRSALPGQLLANAATVYTYDESSVPNRRVVSFLQADGTRSAAVTYFDGYGNEFQQRVETEPGRFLVSGIKLYNPWGDLREEFEPTYATTIGFALPDTTGRPSRRFFYDARGRAVRSVNYNDAVSTVTIEPFRVVTRDCNDTDASAANLLRGQFDTPHEEEFDVFRYLLRVSDRVDGVRQVTTSYEVGSMGELLAVADSRGTKFRYQYDHLGNRLGVQSRDSGARGIWYDARKKPVRTSDAASHVIDARWDTLGRLTQLKSGSSVLETYVYDVQAQEALGRLAEVRYPGGKQVFTYSVAGQLLERAYHYDGVAEVQTLRYEYDPLGREIAKIHNGGTRVARELFSNGWVKSIPDVIDAIAYDPRGLPVEINYHNKVRTQYGYTAGPGRISRQVTTSPIDGVLERIDYTFDKMEILLSSNDTAPNGAGLRQYRYDPLYQLMGMSSVEGGVPVNRIYDFSDDYNLRRFDEASTLLHYNDAVHPDRVSDISVGNEPSVPLAYDGNGNTRSLPGQQFEYNVKNELLRFTRADGLVADYRYDHLGSRISKRVDDGVGNVVTTFYVGECAEVGSVSGVSHIVRLGARRVALLEGGVTTFVHENSSGSTAFVTDATGQRTGQVDTHPFGVVKSKTGSIRQRTYSLHRVDEESGLVYMQRRYYAPTLGRFLTPDLMATFQPEKFLHAPQSLHLYAYVANDPLNKVDPSGMSFWSFMGSVVGVIVGVVVGILIVAATVMTGGIAGVLLGIGLALVASLAVTGVSYIIASNVDPNSAGGQFLRGFMIGFNAGMNGVLASAIFGPVIGVALGVINFLATFDGIAQNSVYKGILGWTSWLMPMSWGMTAGGVVVFLINLIAAGITGNGEWWGAGAKIEKMDFDWRTGSFVMLGGAITGPTAFDMGHFVLMNASYVDGSSFDQTYENVLRHETGHTLALAAFGTAFLIADAIGENVVGSGAEDYGEKIAESNVPGTGRSTIPMWG